VRIGGQTLFPIFLDKIQVAHWSLELHLRCTIVAHPKKTRLLAGLTLDMATSARIDAGGPGRAGDCRMAIKNKVSMMKNFVVSVYLHN